MIKTKDGTGGKGALGQFKAARRRILGGLGAGALMTSVSLFGGKGTAADAAVLPGPACCHLAHYPANTTYSYCHAHAHYIWYCTADGGFLHCACCETAGNAKSAASCQYN